MVIAKEKLDKHDQVSERCRHGPRVWPASLAIGGRAQAATSPPAARPPVCFPVAFSRRSLFTFSWGCLLRPAATKKSLGLVRGEKGRRSR